MVSSEHSTDIALMNSLCLIQHGIAAGSSNEAQWVT